MVKEPARLGYGGGSAELVLVAVVGIRNVRMLVRHAVMVVLVAVGLAGRIVRAVGMVVVLVVHVLM